MTGLLDTFRRHYCVLTNFTGNEVESRPTAARGGTREPVPAGGGKGDRAPQGWVPDVPGDTRRGRSHLHPDHPTPCRGRARSLRSLSGGGYLSAR